MRPDRSEIRELVKQAQAAEVSGERARAADLLVRAAELSLEQGQAGRGAALLRHASRLQPERAGLLERADQLEQGAPPAEPALAVPERGPSRADPAVEAWCSFCCRPGAEVGPLVAGPAGAFVCGPCVGSAAALLQLGPVRSSATIGEPANAPAAPLAVQPVASADDGFIEDAVRLAKELGWGLSELRTLTTDERKRALDALEQAGARTRGRKP